MPQGDELGIESPSVAQLMLYVYPICSISKDQLEPCRGKAAIAFDATLRGTNTTIMLY